MPENKNAQKRNVEFKGYSANQSVDVRNEPQTTEQPKTANNQQPAQESQQTKTTKSSDDKK